METTTTEMEQKLSEHMKMSQNLIPAATELETLRCVSASPGVDVDKRNKIELDLVPENFQFSLEEGNIFHQRVKGKIGKPSPK